MNRNHRHMRYRQSVYRRRSIRTALIAGIIVLVLLLLAFFLLGNLFSKKLEQSPDEPKQTQKTEADPPMPFESVRHVSAPLLSLSGSSSAVYNRLESLQDDGHTALSLPLTDADGTLSYHSPLASSKGYSMKGNASLSLSELIEVAHSGGTYLCGTYVLSAVNEEDALTRSVLLAESAAVIAEAFLAGMDDVVIIVPALPTDRYTEMIRFSESIKSFAPNAVIGLCLPEAEVEAPDATRMDTLAKSFDFLALDLRGNAESDPVALAEDRMSAMLYYLLRYEMRLMLPSLAEADTQTALLDAVQKESLDNWMTVAP